MDANRPVPDLAYGLSDIGAGKPFLRVLAETRPRFLWHLALTRRGQDKQAEDELRLRKHPVYRPKYEVQRRKRSGGFRQETRSIFPGLLFVLPGRHGWEPLRESDHVIGLMRFGEKYATIAHEDADFQRILELEQELSKIPQQAPKFRVGQRVRLSVPVVVGPPMDIWGKIMALDDKGRSDVLIDILKRKVRVKASIEQLNPA